MRPNSKMSMMLSTVVSPTNTLRSDAVGAYIADRTANQCEKFLLILRIGHNELMDMWTSEAYEHCTKVSE